MNSDYYQKRIGGVVIDVYRILRMYEITDPAIQHAIKKLLRCGRGSHKPANTDVKEAIASLQRWIDMGNEDASEALKEWRERSEKP